jgi:uncharacterized repeat protein (TIGR03803 family)
MRNLKTQIKHTYLLSALTVTVCLIFTGQAGAQTFTNLYTLPGQAASMTIGGVQPPQAGLILSGNTLYGTTPWGGHSSDGTVFAVNTNGAGFTNLYNFTGGTNGSHPQASLIFSGGSLFGTTWGYYFGSGTVFSLTLGPAVSAPPLTINLSGTVLTVSWPFSAAGFTLQTNGNLSATNWANYGGTVINNSVTNSLPAGNLFFRLQQPP